MNRQPAQQAAAGILLLALLTGSFFFLLGALNTPRGVVDVNRLLDIQLSTRIDPEGERSIYQVVIRMDRRAPYDIFLPGDESSLLVRLPELEVPHELLRRTMSNDLVQNVWIKPDGNGYVTIRFDLASTQVAVHDYPETSKDWAIVIDLQWDSPVRQRAFENLLAQGVLSRTTT